MLNVNVDRYHTTNRTATCQQPLFVGVRGWPVNSMVTVKIYDNGTYIGNSPSTRIKSFPAFENSTEVPSMIFFKYKISEL